MEQTHGIFLFVADKFLICKNTGSNTWSIPKGLADVGEDSYQAAVRELQEETGIILNCYKHKVLAQLEPIQYKKKPKKLYSWVLEIESGVLEQELVCSSMVDNGITSPFPECDQFIWISAYDKNLPIHQSQLEALNNWFKSLI